MQGRHRRRSTVEHDGKTRTHRSRQGARRGRLQAATRKGLGLEEVGVKIDERGHILADEQLQTNVPSIYAVGDVSGAPYLAHKAYQGGRDRRRGDRRPQGRARLARDARGHLHRSGDRDGRPRARREAKAKGIEIKIGKFPFSRLGRAMAVNENDGFMKTIVDAKNDEVLGVRHRRARRRAS